jgi:hypothetical protein
MESQLHRLGFNELLDRTLDMTIQPAQRTFRDPYSLLLLLLCAAAQRRDSPAGKHHRMASKFTMKSMLNPVGCNRLLDRLLVAPCHSAEYFLPVAWRNVQAVSNAGIDRAGRIIEQHPSSR